jgi:NAD(P)-dependent dehydrogenase (short-subunit alcohol dehydrogenase family)
MQLGLTNKVALVTGASRGIGAACAGTLAAEGVRVAVGYHADQSAADQVVAAIASAGGQAQTVQLDLTLPQTITAAIASIEQRWGGVDVLVACAWITPGWAPPEAALESTPAAAWQTQLRGNVEGTVATIQAVLPHMRASGWGRIVLISSGAAEDGSPGLEHYGAAKSALHGLSRGLARSAGPAGILINVVVPGLIATARHRQFIPAEVLEQVAANTPIRRLASEDDVAHLVTFLASACNGAVTGSEVRVSGGLRM